MPKTALGKLTLAFSQAHLACFLAVAMAVLFNRSGPVFAEPVRAPGESLGLSSIPNLRDIGGYATRDGFVVRRQLLFRSNQLNPVPPEDLERLARIELKTDFDLRTEEERKLKPDETPMGVRNVWLNVLADLKDVSAAEITRLLSNPVEANKALGNGKAEQLMMKVYREFVNLPSARASYGRLFQALQDPAELPALYHCTAGKDRTGWASAALLSLLGVPEDQVYADYLRSNDYMLPAYEPLINRFAEGGGDPSIVRAILGVRREYLNAAFDEMRSKYGSIEEYFTFGLGIDKAGQEALRARYLTAN